MLINDPKRELQAVLIRRGLTLKSIAPTLGISAQAASNRVNGKIINDGFVELCEAAGYDVVVELIERK